MKLLKIALLFSALSFFSFLGVHKYYISITQVNYIEEKKALQITSRIFIDDMERLLRVRYDDNITLSVKNENPIVDTYLENYLKAKFQLKINGKAVNYNFIGKDYDIDIMRCYLEVDNVKSIESLEISNTVLFDIFDDQQNIVKTNINTKQKSVILMVQKDTALLKFN